MLGMGQEMLHSLCDYFARRSKYVILLVASFSSIIIIIVKNGSGHFDKHIGKGARGRIYWRSPLACFERSSAAR